MFYMTSLSPYEGEIKTLRFKFDPIATGRIFGALEDAEGRRWDARGCAGGCLLLRPYVDDYFTSTRTGWSGIHTDKWIPYRYEVVK